MLIPEDREMIQFFLKTFVIGTSAAAVILVVLALFVWYVAPPFTAHMGAG